MRETESLRKALGVLEARVQALEVMLTHEMRIKAELRSRQVAITEQEHELSASLQEDAAIDPASFRFRELRLRKLSNDQRRLQPALAKAAMQRRQVEGTLKAMMRQRLGLALQIEKREARLPVFQTEEERAQILFEMKKRH
ncbi:hypothetical protein [uncultured Marivita sp.]|uniref:hypothetical protein n=1 Tax=uncultured Marivita sp. TaxID=888080 RepID=UPI00261EA1A8|nr:hypothetical protein [uncultured Marivita sp.]